MHSSIQIHYIASLYSGHIIFRSCVHKKAIMKRAHIGSGLQKKETPRPQEDSRDQRSEENTEENILENEEENGQNQLNDENAGPSKKRKRTSLIWKHFTIKFLQEENAEFAFCNYCNKK